MIMEEIWKPVVGHEDMYRVSNLGRVMSINYRHTGKPHILTPKKRCGYMAIHRRSNGGDIAIHRLVAEAFIANPDNLPCVNHINEDKCDNRACNLEWCTHQYNNTYGNRLIKMANTRKSSKTKTHKGDIYQYSITGEYIATFTSTISASAETGIERSSINKCALGQTKTAGGYKWSYNYSSSLFDK